MDVVQTLTGIVIIDPIGTYLVLQLALSCGVVATMVVYVNIDFYYDWYPINTFFPLAIKGFRCLHQ